MMKYLKNRIFLCKLERKVNMKIFRKILIFTALLYTYCILSNLSASDLYFPKLTFKYLTMSDGLSNYKVNTIFADKDGFFWFGTNEGLNRYDGYNFIVYQTDTKPDHNISSNVIRKIIQGSEDELIIANDGGVDIFNMQTESFTKILSKDPDYPIDLTWTIHYDLENTLWIGTINGLYYLKSGDKMATLFSNENSWFNDYDVQKVCSLNEYILIGTYQDGLIVYNNKTKSYNQFKNTGANDGSISGNMIVSVYKDIKDNIWVGTNNNGLNKFNIQTRQFKKVFFENMEDQNIKVRDLKEDKYGRLWLGSKQGLFLYNEKNEKFTRYAHVNDAFSILVNNSIYEICIDNNDMLWLGTYSGGVNYCDFNQKKFKFYEYRNDDNRYLNDRVVYTINDYGDKLWIGTENGGINIFDKEKQIYTYLDLASLNVKSRNIKVILKEAGNTFWIGTYENGLIKYTPGYHSAKIFLPKKNYKHSISNNIVYSLMFDSDSNLWIGTRNGVDMKLKGKNVFKYFSADISPENERFPDVVSKLFMDRKNQIWLGSAVNGLFKFNHSDSIFYFYNDTFSSIGILDINEDQLGNIWVTSNNGLYCIDDNKIYHYTKDDGLQINTIYNIEEDKNFNLWMSSSYGITKFIDGVRTPERPNFENFTSTDGIQIKQFINNSNSYSKFNMLYFGGVNGFISFNPDEIVKNPIKPVVKITNFKIFNKEVRIGDKTSKRNVLRQSILQTDEITLSYKNKVFTIEFAALHFSNPEKNQYKYKLVGFDNDWTYTGSKVRSATYTNLHGGKYEFLVMASNNDGVWNDEPTSLRIRILPAVWQTLWFYIVIIVLVVITVIVVISLKTKALNMQNKLLEDRVKERTNKYKEANNLLKEKQEEIIMQNEELAKHRNHLEVLVDQRTEELLKAKDKAEESDRLKSAFLANMSHEIRTPMNAIVGFTKIISNRSSDSQQKRFYDIINRNSQSLMVLIDDILDISKIDSKQLKIYKSNFEVHQILDELYEYFITKNERRLEIKLVKEKNNLQLYNDPVRFKQIFTNLLTNAFKFTKEGKIEFGYKTVSDKVIFFVSDTGAGIDSKYQDLVFNYFYKVDEVVDELNRGTGIGLSISKKLVELMDGKIWLESVVNKGSTFYFSLPYKEITISIPDTEKTNISETNGSIRVNILVAEDEEDNYMLLEQILKEFSTKIIFWARNGKQMVDYISKLSDPTNTVILMDIKMPVMDGIQAIEKIKKIYKEIPVIALTAYASDSERIDILSHGFSAYISKPINTEILYKTILSVTNK